MSEPGTSSSTGTPPKKRRKAHSSTKGKQKQKKASTSHVSVGPSTSATLPLPSRSRPPIVHYPEGPPSNPKFLKLRHPANGLTFLKLPAYDKPPGPQLQFGVYHETVITACMIIACNCPGYLSKSRTRDVDRVCEPLNSFLLPDVYYYHLNDYTETGELYPICNNLRNWSFSHENFPLSWALVLNDTGLQLPNTDWTAVSERIKARDTVCLISGYTLTLSTAHVVSEEDSTWLDENKMDDYLGDTMPCHQSQRNLFCLQYDLHIPLFDRAFFAIVPKNGKLIVHFLRYSAEYANQFHNVVFNHNHNLSHEALYARFAWALMKIVKESQLDSKKFKILGSKEKHSKPGRARGDNRGPSKTHREDGDGDGEDGEDNVEEDFDDDGEVKEQEDDSDDNDDSRTYQSPGSRQRNPDALTLQSDSWLYDVLHKMAPGDNQSSLKVDECEIEADLTRAARDHPFLVDSSIKPTAHNYENILWYPGMGVVKRRK